MSSATSPAPYTFEQLMESFRESRKEIAELRLAIKESHDKFNKQFEKLGNRIGELIESMVEG